MDITYTETDQQLIDLALTYGACHAAVADAHEIVLDPVFREICASNSCGMYDKCWTCPPCVGSVEKVIAEIRSYSKFLLIQTIGQLEDSYDLDGMNEAAVVHRNLITKLQKVYRPENFDSMLFLTVGGCRLCPVCSKREGKPCRHSDLALASLESYCIHVSSMAKTCHMNYINGENTVTYFSALFYNPKSEG